MMAASAKEWKKLLDVEGLWQLLKDFKHLPTPLQVQQRQYVLYVLILLPDDMITLCLLLAIPLLLCYLIASHLLISQQVEDQGVLLEAVI